MAEHRPGARLGGFVGLVPEASPGWWEPVKLWQLSNVGNPIKQMKCRDDIYIYMYIYIYSYTYIYIYDKYIYIYILDICNMYI